MSQCISLGDASPPTPPSPDSTALTRFDFICKAKRAFIRHLLKHETATIDDVHAVVEIPLAINPKCMGEVPRVFHRLGYVEAVGYVPTRRKQAHSRRITRWKLCDAAKAEKWLAAHSETKQGGQV
jgi:hypothetical protein